MPLFDKGTASTLLQLERKTTRHTTKATVERRATIVFNTRHREKVLQTLTTVSFFLSYGRLPQQILLLDNVLVSSIKHNLISISLSTPSLSLPHHPLMFILPSYVYFFYKIPSFLNFTINYLREPRRELSAKPKCSKKSIRF